MQRQQQKRNKRKIAILHNIRSVHNVGAIFRSCDAFGVREVWCTGYTPSPVDMLGRVRKDFAKTALGAEEHVVWKKEKSISMVIKRLQREGVIVAALEQSEKSLPLKQIMRKNDVAILVGNEVRGIDARTLKQCDVIYEIPMRGKKESLNVSVTFGIGAFALFS